MDLKITEHFTYNEMTNTSHLDLLAQNRAEGVGSLQNMGAVCKELEKVRTFTSKPIIITSGFRCRDLNKRLGGVETSDHCDGSAADFVPVGFEDSHGLRSVFDWCVQNLDYSEIVYECPVGRKPWIHVARAKVGKTKEVWVWNGKDYEAPNGKTA